MIILVLLLPICVQVLFEISLFYNSNSSFETNKFTFQITKFAGIKQTLYLFQFVVDFLLIENTDSSKLDMSSSISSKYIQTSLSYLNDSLWKFMVLSFEPISKISFNHIDSTSSSKF